MPSESAIPVNSRYSFCRQKDEQIEKEKKRIGARCLFHQALLDELKETLGEENVVMK